MIQALLNLFPVKTNSLEEFIERVERGNGKVVFAKPTKEWVGLISHLPAHGVLGIVGDAKYCAVYSCVTKSGRKIIYKEEFCTRAESEGHDPDVEGKINASNQSLLTIISTLEQIRAEIPITTEIVKTDGTYWTKEDYDRVEVNARESTISV